MDRRGTEGLMDWEPERQLGIDPSSPFAAALPKKFGLSPFETPVSRFSKVSNDPFASVVRKSSPLKQDHPAPPHAAFFSPQIQNKPSGPAFRNPAFTTPRNPAFTTPQKRFEDTPMSEVSDADSSPAMTDTSILPADTPDIEHIGMKSAATPSPIKLMFNRNVERNRLAGKGELPKSGPRDKVRKRKRLFGDRDVGSVRSRLPHESDESDSDIPEGSKALVKNSKQKKIRKRGWLSDFLAALSDNPNAPAVLSRWLQLGANILLTCLAFIVVIEIGKQVRNDLSLEGERAKADLISEIGKCAEEFSRNRCSPKAERPPYLDVVCNEWEVCMHRDPNIIIQTNISVRKVAEILNEFVGVISYKTWAFLLTIFLATLFATNVGFGRLRDPGPSHHTNAPAPAPPLQSPPAMAPMLPVPSDGYFWAPVGMTPKSVRKQLLGEATDTDDSPVQRAIMAPPQTPSLRRSPSKEYRDRERERDRSPSKGSRQRSPSKNY
ncbi:Di-sulfide bridge nucleocytoplasmic transport domain-containing protein [Triangularia verruculosa]|uniref:Di-sulfide bridge nucleocytoplasmic transport domain-containing protein n=1 Tax=Triangularia verruculosa TaxID=2587418 RepID=A0AAN7AUP6_9PEZI|nr:Di-sulfide bridge nucleocytoplasmic transport domain-containing protein [Triangularia verruculosa]